MTEISEEQAREQLNASAAKVKPEDVDKVLGRQEEVEKKAARGPLSGLIKDLKLMFSLVRDYSNGSYREIPWSSIAAIVGALAYVISPVDLIPDFIPVIGYLDDAAVVALCLKLVKSDIDDYAEWKKAQK